MGPAMQPYRAFVSYSHQDSDKFTAVRKALRDRELSVTSDAEIRPGQGFTEQIQLSIGHAHVFVPILTAQSHERGWVHQEIGFSVALQVPCVPVCIGSVRLPEGMIAKYHAVTVRDDLADLDQQIATVNFDDLIETAGRTEGPLACVADEPEERSETIAKYCNEAFSQRGACRVRVSGGFSSFSLPDHEPDHVTWKAAYGKSQRGVFAYQRLRNELVALKRHVPKGGLSLVLDLGRNLDGHRGDGVTRTRLCLLRDFLKSAHAEGASLHIAVVLDHRPDLPLAVGDWFFARSRAARVETGVVHTTFTTHAPTISRRIAAFDARLDSLMKDQGTLPEQSYAHALSKIEERIGQLPAHPDWSGS
jgi:hypothetical protein